MWERWRQQFRRKGKNPDHLDPVGMSVLPTFSTSAATGAAKKKKDSRKIRQRQLFRVSSVAAGIQFGWALQLSLLTPYVQELGIPHTFASYIWLCGPITGMIVQPIVGYYSDNCGSRWGRRRPFLVAGCVCVIIAVLIIGFSADLGHLFGDSMESTTKTRAIVMFVLGFWLLDLANNTLQGPCRALLADLTGRSQKRTRRANAFFSLFMAIGNILGFATGAYGNWAKVFPFAITTACDMACANLKSAFFLDIIMLIFTTLLSITAAPEVPLSEILRGGGVGAGGGGSSKNDGSNSTSTLRRILSNSSERRDVENAHGRQNLSDSTVENGKLVAKPWNNLSADHGKELETILSSEGLSESPHGPEVLPTCETENKAFFWELFSTMKTLPRQMWYILLVTALTWVAWFPFLLYDTDWMGHEIYRGQPDSRLQARTDLYNKGVRMGSFGLMLNSVVLGLTSLMVEPLCRRVGPSYLWGFADVILAFCFAGIVGITKVAEKGRSPPSAGVLTVVLLLFSILGIPLAVTYSVPYALTASYTSSIGGGQGLSMGVLNLAVVIPQVIISLGSGPWDQAFGGGNIPSFLVASGAALIGGVLAISKLPKTHTKRDHKPPPIEVEFPTPGIRRTRSAPVFSKMA
ncbi:sucrose transport protein SUC4 [Selaginella moellendorffii]|uniref:sucrose transport protein SUC4 n=1 Tax=Selaginella moellendorffii TaxID=88036 RepID=UPI000D1C720D|nr:sucrose transport protein SUC4 [Selaginella moellendorffii]|eukprot:XP_024518052.1 sucrose transport protein SUC4 [Selaginella moellendorffii]